MDYIMVEIPWQCDDRDCSMGWHKSNYWTDEEGNYWVDYVSNSDRDPVDESDVPSFEKQEAAWKRYQAYVAKTGEDPLGEYLVKASYKRKARYVLQFRNSIGGAILCRWKRGRGAWTSATPPEEVIGYMFLDDWPPNPNTANRRPIKDSVPQPDGTFKRKYYKLDEFLDLARSDEHVHKVTKAGPFHNIHITLEETVLRSEKAVRRELRQRARCDLREAIKQAKGGE